MNLWMILRVLNCPSFSRGLERGFWDEDGFIRVVLITIEVQRLTSPVCRAQ